MEIKDRIKQFMDTKGLTIKAFEKEIGSSNGSWSGAKTLSEDVLLKTLARFPELNSDWVLKGKGDMFSNDDVLTCNNEELIRLKEENEKLRNELRMKDDPEQTTKESEVYRLWMKQMEITERMQELYKIQKEGKV